MSGRVVDARGLEPPEPFERAMDGLMALAKDEEMVLILDRDGYGHTEAFRDDGAVEIRIRQR